MPNIVTRPGAWRPLRVLSGVCFALGWMCACQEPAPVPDAPISRSEGNAGETRAGVDAERGPRIVFLGDSLTAGYGVAETEAFPALVAEALQRAGYDVDIVNAGVSGDTSAGGLSRIDWVLRARPDVLVLELGGNDALRGQPLENTEQNLRRIVERAESAGARVVLLGMDVPTNYGPEYTGAFSELYGRIARDMGIAFVPGFVREVGLSRRLMQLDGIHPTAEGHRRLAGVLLPHLEGLLD